MTAARAHVVRIRVDATGTDDVVAAFIATKKTPYEVHDLIMEALKDYRPACGGYQQGEEVPFPSLLFFALDQTKGSTYPGKRLLSVQEIDELGLTVQEIAEAFNDGSLTHLSEAEVAELTTKASAREFASLTAPKG